MIKVAFLALVATMIPLCAIAQVRKCVDATGKTIYSDVACAATTTRESQVDAGPNGLPPPPPEARGNGRVVRSPHDQQIRNKIAEYLARGDFDSATNLAVTEDQFAMISTARRQQGADKAARRAAGPTVCSTSAHTQGATTTGTAVCKNVARRDGSSTSELIDKVQAAKGKAALDMADTMSKAYKR